MKSDWIIFIMGVSGAGKSTIGKLLAEDLDVPFFDADDLHPKANIEKMASGEALEDADRRPWLKSINEVANQHATIGGCVIACSALKQAYRSTLSTGITDSVTWVHLIGSYELIWERLKERKGHFMPSNLLKSQFAILECPEGVIEVEINQSPQQILEMIKTEFKSRSQFGLIGLGVMGKSLSRNLANNNFKLSLFNRHVDNSEVDVAKNFIGEHNELNNAMPFDSLPEFVHSLQSPRKIMLMVNAGKTVDTVIDNLLPHLSEGDIIIDGGNSNYEETNRRAQHLKSNNIHFIGSGVSGGEEGALKGPSIMPGGDAHAYHIVAPYLEAIAASDVDSNPCCTYIGPAGSGHFVKMVHNGIEYAEMQLLCEVFGILKAYGKNQDEIADILKEWRQTANSYLLEITIDILLTKEGDDYLLDKILDKAGNKGTGNWATIASTKLGMPSTLIASALFARYTSFHKNDREKYEGLYSEREKRNQEFSNSELLQAYQFARIINHHQGFQLMQSASNTYEWNLNLSEIARIWTNGCIIRSSMMKEFVEFFKQTNDLLSSDIIIKRIKDQKQSLIKVVAQCVQSEISIPCLSDAMNFFNSMTTSRSTANLIQAQRDYFGAHKYQRLDDDSEEYYHTKWK